MIPLFDEKAITLVKICNSIAGTMDLVCLYNKQAKIPVTNALTIIPTEYVWAIPKSKLERIAAGQKVNFSSKNEEKYLCI